MAGRYADWLTKQQAAERIEVSTKTIEKLAKDGKLQYRLLPQQGKPAIVIYHPGDVARVWKERHPEEEPFILPPGESMPAPGQPEQLTSAVVSASPTSPKAAEPFLHELIMALRRNAEVEVTQPQQPPQTSDHRVRLAERLFLTMKEAAEYSGLPPVYLRKLIDDGKLEAIPVNAAGSKRIRRADLEQL